MTKIKYLPKHSSIGDYMCTVGGPMADLKMKKLKTKRYRCLDCGNEFQGIGKRVVCPSCQSENVEESN